jgi:hypothetical protein
LSYPTCDELKEFLEELVHAETPEEKIARYNFYINLGKLVVIGTAVLALWGIVGQLIGMSNVYPHCVQFQNALPVCK